MAFLLHQDAPYGLHFCIMNETTEWAAQYKQPNLKQDNSHLWGYLQAVPSMADFIVLFLDFGVWCCNKWLMNSFLSRDKLGWIGPFIHGFCYFSLVMAAPTESYYWMFTHLFCCFLDLLVNYFGIIDSWLHLGYVYSSQYNMVLLLLVSIDLVLLT